MCIYLCLSALSVVKSDPVPTTVASVPPCRADLSRHSLFGDGGSPAKADVAKSSFRFISKTILPRRRRSEDLRG